ncbi:Serine protease gd [Pseudolycoriella hygida]|uniref:Serine protease gd n=1 Tax=Pseudolycoriella hygida TaxID=35572 RepID=A0A9Q0MQ14_9DIPT|nr:Serine protease gd [Pseudolycoriella hygida]
MDSKDSDTETYSSTRMRLGLCEVCNHNLAKYCCPKCEVKTCCIECLNIHKKELDCNGIRNKTTFIPLKSMTDSAFMSDYCFLEDCTRYVADRKRDKIKSFTSFNKRLPSARFKLREAARERGTQLRFLLSNFTRNAINSSHFDRSTDTIIWNVEWIFPNAEQYKIRQECSENKTLRDFVENHLSSTDTLVYYKSRGIGNLTFLLKAECVKKCSNRFFELDMQKSLKENLIRKILIEYPIIYVVFSDVAREMFDVIDDVEEVERETKSYLKEFELLCGKRKANKLSSDDSLNKSEQEMQETMECLQIQKNSHHQRRVLKKLRRFEQPQNFLFTNENTSDSEPGSSDDSDEEVLQPCKKGYDWIGYAQIPSLPIGQAMKLEIMLSLRAKLPSQFVGAVELFGSRQDAISQIQSNQPVRYRIRFPLQNPLPKLTQLSLNGQVLCSGPAEVAAYVTQIKLEHTLFTDISAGGQPVSGFDNNLYSQNRFITYNNRDNYYSQTYQQRPSGPDRPQSFYTTQPPQPFYTTQTPQPFYVTPPPPPPYTPPTQPPYVPSSYPVQSVQPVQPNYDYSINTQQSESEICGRMHPKFNFGLLVVGGYSIRRGDWPWLVAVYLNKATSLSFNCGGNLVSARTVVTAAHCFKTSDRQYRPEEVLLFLGRFNILNWGETGSKTAEVQQIIIHNDYMKQESSYDADIAVVIMREKVQYTEYIRPICLWEGTDGLNSVEGQFGTEECLRSSDTYRYITSDRTFCAGGRDGRGPCNGDSGGGFALNINNKWMLRGLVSAALADPIVNTCNLGEYVVFTDAAKFVSWIRYYMQ